MIVVAYVSYLASDDRGGQVNLLRLLTALDPARFRGVLVVPADGRLAERARAAEVPVVVAPIRPLDWLNVHHVGRTLRSRRRLAEALDAHGVHVLYVDAPEHVQVARQALGARPIPLLWHVQTAFRTRFDRAGAAAADAIVCVSEAARARFRAFGLDDKLLSIPNAVDTVRFSPGSGAASRHALGVAPGERVGLYVGGLNREKGILDLVEALPASGLDRLWVVGKGKPRDEARLHARIRQHGVDARVHLLGYRPDIPDLLRACDVFVMPSHAEGMSLALLEAMAAGAPIVATRIPGNTEVLTEHSGILVPPSEPVSLAAGIRALAEDPERARALGRSARSATDARYGVNRYVEAFDRAFTRLATEARQRR